MFAPLIKKQSKTIFILAAIFMICTVFAMSRGWKDDVADVPQSKLPEVNGHLSLLWETATPLSLSDVLSADVQAEFRPVPGNGVNPGYTRKAFWLSLRLPPAQTEKAILSLSPNFLDYIDVYVSQPGEGKRTEAFSHYSFGDHQLPPVDGVSAIEPAVGISLASNLPTQVYIRVWNTGTFTQINLRLDPVETVALRNVNSGILVGLWFGAMLALLMTQFMFFRFHRKLSHLLLALSTFGVIAVYFGNLGLSMLHLFPGNGAANDTYIGVTAWGGMSLTALFYASLFSIPGTARFIHFAYGSVALTGVIGIAFAIAGDNVSFGPYGTSAASIGSLLTMLIAWWQFNRDGQASRLTALACTMTGIGITVAVVQRFGFTSLPGWVWHSYGVSVLLQTLLLTGVVAIRLRDAENLNRAMQADALHQSQSAERTASKLVEERTQELVKARRVAEEALRAEMDSQLRQVRFLEVVSHQYATPLASIRSNIDGLQVTLENIDAANLTRIGRIRRAVTRLVEIVEVNLTRSRLQGPSFRADMKEHSALNILTAALQRARDLLSDPDIRLEVASEAADAMLVADASMLELAIINLLENAVKYSRFKENAPIILSLEQWDNHIVIAVADRGIGIPAADISQVFEDAHRGSNAHSTEGSGLGLFLVAKIASVHNGKVEVESTEGEGTLIRIVLPTDVA